MAGHLNVFVAEKNFEGCGGLVITDEIRVCVAANACLLLLHRRTDYFPGLRSILVYPKSHFAQVTEHVGNGVWEEGWQSRAGEAWPFGAIVLAWGEVFRSAVEINQSNVILHEFANQLDHEDGGWVDGIPLLGEGESFAMRKHRCAEWIHVMTRDFKQLREQIEIGMPTFLNAYAAKNSAEFFAVATESFFCQTNCNPTPAAFLVP